MPAEGRRDRRRAASRSPGCSGSRSGSRLAWAVLIAIVTLLGAQQAPLTAPGLRRRRPLVVGVRRSPSGSSRRSSPTSSPTRSSGRRRGVEPRSIVLGFVGGLAPLEHPGADRRATSSRSRSPGRCSRCADRRCCSRPASLLGTLGDRRRRAVAGSLVVVGALEPHPRRASACCPAMPLDGGRVVRALAWARTDDRDRAGAVDRARRPAARLVTVIGVGIAMVLADLVTEGLLVIALGWLLTTGARTSTGGSRSSGSCAASRVREAMERRPAVRRPEPHARHVRRPLRGRRTRVPAMPVVDDDRSSASSGAAPPAAGPAPVRPTTRAEDVMARRRRRRSWRPDDRCGTRWTMSERGPRRARGRRRGRGSPGCSRATASPTAVRSRAAAGRGAPGAGADERRAPRASRRPRRRSLAGVDAARRHRADRRPRRRWAACSPSRSSPRRRCRRGTTPRWTATRSGRRTWPARPRTGPCGSTVVGESRAGVGARRAGACPGRRSGSRPAHRCRAGADAVVPVEVTTPLDAQRRRRAARPRCRRAGAGRDAWSTRWWPGNAVRTRGSDVRGGRRDRCEPGDLVTPAVGRARSRAPGSRERRRAPAPDRRGPRDRRRGAGGRAPTSARPGSPTRTARASGRSSGRRAPSRWTSGSRRTGSRTSRRGSGAGSPRRTSSSCRAASRSARTTSSGSRSTTVGHMNLWRVAVQPGKPFAFGRADVEGRPTRCSCSACRATRCRRS